MGVSLRHRDVLDLSNNSEWANSSMPLSDERCWLQPLGLNQSRLEGKVPKSLGNRKCLEVLDIGNNQINDSFPCHLKNIAKLHVLVLRSNKFNGHIDCPRSNNGWPMLQIFDLASNNFSGKLHMTCLGTWDAMQPNSDKGQSELKHLINLDFGDDDFKYYEDAIPVTIKGNKLELVKIPVNNFEGPIPEVIGKFEALDALNFSHNAFTGSIPTTFGNLRELGSYSLVGPIPTSTQLQSFSEASFENNTGLCGPPLKTMCGLPPAKEDSPSDSETGSIIH
ncbi:hypothetical protein Gotri_023443 [Gossypium trilobum]|uniref:Uncharacterized protein n=1 Tax=Gossypium trilobum TaxID=34281 RepID=A0A7J9DJ36_9ROSI|nr:hypothetical protein [Gossypium trilobum]